MILILCHLHDAEAAWLCQRLRQLAPATEVRLVSAEELLYARGVRHTLGRAPASFALTLQNGQHVAGKDVTVLINRLCYLDPVLWQQRDAKQYQYVMQELNALYLSILHSLPAERLYNPPTAVALGGRTLAPAEWQLLAARVGLSIAAGWPPPPDQVPAPPEARVLVLDDELLGTVPAGIAPEACRELARQADVRLLELHFTRQGAEYVVVGATTLAALHCYGDALVRHFLSVSTTLPLPADGPDMGNTQRVARAALAGGVG
ncbi:MAG TPA: hypothetical protein VF629_22315 [Hymenobacter sp.]|jgi:hypothetical protein|uniref:hypothetical protein n=1 Tax=Hymenobacter sp. TaxID=1898978 RepID=UPI002ED80CD4